MAQLPSPLSGNAGMDLGLGSTLGAQVADETEEEKRRRRLAMQGLSPLAAGSQSVMALGPGLSLGRGGGFGRGY